MFIETLGVSQWFTRDIIPFTVVHHKRIYVFTVVHHMCYALTIEVHLR